jgi:hypothetical protein
MSNRNPDVDSWLENYDKPQRELASKIRDFILSVDPALTASLQDELGLLEGDGEVSRVARFADEADFEAKMPGLEAVLLAWIKDQGPGK